MGISDILTLIGLIFAIFAFIYEAEREFIFIKFYWLDSLILLGAFLALNYLLFNSFYLERGYYLDIVMHTWGWKTSTWSYAISISLIGYLFYRIFFGVIPYSNRERLISFYERLLNKGDYAKIMANVEKYHETKMFEYHSQFAKSQHLEKAEYEGADGHEQWKLMRGDIKYKTGIHFTNQQNLAGAVYRWVVERDDFIEGTANEFPYFYSDIFKQFNYKYSPNEETVGTFFSTLLKNNNKFLKRELKSNINLTEGEFYNYRFEEDNRLLKCLLEDLRVAENTYIWRPFGETAIQEIRSFDEDHFIFSIHDSDIHTEAKFLDLTIFKSARFFDILVRRVIFNHYKYHMWLSYYYHIVQDLLEEAPLKEELPLDDDEWKTDYPTNYCYFIYKVTSNMYDWYRAMENAQSIGHVSIISKTISGILAKIANSDAIGDQWKINQFKLFIQLYCSIHSSLAIEAQEQQVKDVVNSITKSIETAMLKPGYVKDNLTMEYHRILKSAWDEFDGLEYSASSLENLQEQVFDKIKT